METTESETQEKKSARNDLLIPGAIIVAGAMIALAVLYGVGGIRLAPAGDVKNPPGAAGPKTNAQIADDDPALGNPNAPVVVVEFSDFQCPFCGRFHQTVEPQLINDYVKTGKVRFVYRDFAFLGEESLWAAQAADCANEQGKFWEYHDYLFARQNGENRGAFAKDNLKSFAQALKLNTSQFNSCLDSGKYAPEVEKDLADAKLLGVSATPTNYVNGVQITGAVPYDQFKAALDQALAKTGK